MVFQFTPFAFGLMVVVAVGTIAYTLMTDRIQMHKVYEYPQARLSPKLSAKKRSKKSIDNNDSCVICLEVLNHWITTLPCGHVLHTHCKDEWVNVQTNKQTNVQTNVQTKPTCPVCRRAI